MAHVSFARETPARDSTLGDLRQYCHVLEEQYSSMAKNIFILVVIGLVVNTIIDILLIALLIERMLRGQQHRKRKSSKVFSNVMVKYLVPSQLKDEESNDNDEDTATSASDTKSKSKEQKTVKPTLRADEAVTVELPQQSTLKAGLNDCKQSKLHIIKSERSCQADGLNTLHKPSKPGLTSAKGSRKKQKDTKNKLLNVERTQIMPPKPYVPNIRDFSLKAKKISSSPLVATQSTQSSE